MRRAAARGAPAARAGTTLIELMLVMGLLAILLGAGVGVLASVDVGRRQAVGLVKNVLRSAQNTALARRAPASVRVDREGRTLTPWVWRPVGTWHFEDASLEGAFGIRGALIGGRIVEDGYIGRALSFAGEPTESRAVFDVEGRAAYDVTDGFSLECALLRDGEASFRVLNLGDSCGLDVLSGGAVRGWFVPAIERESGSGFARGSAVVAESDAGALPLGRWARVRVDYDRRVLRVAVDGVEVARRAETARAHRPGGSLTVSEERSRFEGAIDALVVRALTREGEATLPEGVTFAPSSAETVSYDSGGGLDRREHREPVVLTIVHEDGDAESVRVGMYGTVEDAP